MQLNLWWAKQNRSVNFNLHFVSPFSYMDYAVELLDGDCTVYHAPWSGDGGSLDTRYMLQCLPMFLSSSFYEPVQYDAIIFNAGIHDIDCCDYHNEVSEIFSNLPKSSFQKGNFCLFFVWLLFLFAILYLLHFIYEITIVQESGMMRVNINMFFSYNASPLAEAAGQYRDWKFIELQYFIQITFC